MQENTMKRLALSAALAAFSPAVALAHSGHGDEVGHAHAIGSVEVLVLMLAVGAGALGVRQLARVRRGKK
jgi:hypothetical protein